MSGFEPVRLTCLQCSAKLPPDLRTQQPDSPFGVRSTTIDALDMLGLFCTLRCAARYGYGSAKRDLGLAAEHGRRRDEQQRRWDLRYPKKTTTKEKL